jgi:hypothetical protein
LFFLARRTQNSAKRAALLGLATGFGYGLASAHTKGMTEQSSDGGVIGVLASWQLYAATAAGITATWLLQNAYHAGRLAAAQPGITLADPAVSTAWGILVFHEQVRGGYFLRSPCFRSPSSLAACSCSAAHLCCRQPSAPARQRVTLRKTAAAAMA